MSYRKATDELIGLLAESQALPGRISLPREAMNMLLYRIAEQKNHIDTLTTLCDTAEQPTVSEGRCTLTTYQVREALGQDVSTWVERMNQETP